MRNARTVVLALLLLAVAGCDGYDPTSLGPAVGGHVYDAITNQPVEGAMIEIGGRVGASAFNGVFWIAEVPRGTHQLRVTKSGYTEYLVEVKVEGSVSDRKVYLAK